MLFMVYHKKGLTMTKKQYRVVCCVSPGELETCVEELLNNGEGWSLQGGVNVSSYPYYSQAIIRDAYISHKEIQMGLTRNQI